MKRRQVPPQLQYPQGTSSRVRSRNIQASPRLCRSIHPLLEIQQTIGNQALQRILDFQTIQPKLAASTPNDRYEQEADRIAAQVLRKSDPGIQRTCAPCAAGGPPCSKCQSENAEENIQRKKSENALPQLALSNDSVQAFGVGQPLDPVTRSFFESRFGYDFNEVRVHTSNAAADSAQSVNALAYTAGRNIVFGADQYKPSTDQGRRLLAHELTHVLQQKTQVSPRHIQRKTTGCESKVGTCDFYTCMSDQTPGDRASGYYWNYGKKYCERFKSSSLARDAKAARWLDCVTLNLHRAILSQCIKHGNDLDKIKACAYATHAKVYTDCGICELDKTFIKQLKVVFTPDAGDLWTKDGLKQVVEALGRCFVRPFHFQMIIDRYTSWGNLDEEKLGKDLAGSAKSNPTGNFPVILGIIELLSNTFDDDDVALEFVKSLTDEDLDTLAETSDGRRILFLMKHAMKGGYTSGSEKKQIKRIGNRSRR